MIKPVRLSILIFLPVLFWVGAASTNAQNELVQINVDLTCGNIGVAVNSDFDRTLKVDAFVGTQGQSNWDLRGVVGDWLFVNPNSSGNRIFDFENQPPNTSISFSVRAWDTETNLLVASREGTQDCDGEDPPPTTSTDTNTNVPANTPLPFLTSCSASGGVLFQPLDGNPAVQITGQQISQGVLTAQTTGQNVFLAGNGTLSVFALGSSELLVTTPNTRTGLPSNICAQLGTFAASTSNNAIIADAGACPVPAGASAVHQVRAGENLFRIGLRHGVNFNTLAAFNNIADPTRIFVGQCIAIP